MAIIKFLADVIYKQPQFKVRELFLQHLEMKENSWIVLLRHSCLLCLLVLLNVIPIILLQTFLVWEGYQHVLPLKCWMKINLSVVCHLKMSRTSSIVKNLHQKLPTQNNFLTIEMLNTFLKFFHCGITRYLIMKMRKLSSASRLVILIQSVPSNWNEYFVVRRRWWFCYFRWLGKGWVDCFQLCKLWGLFTYEV